MHPLDVRCHSLTGSCGTDLGSSSSRLLPLSGALAIAAEGTLKQAGRVVEHARAATSGVKFFLDYRGTAHGLGASPSPSSVAPRGAGTIFGIFTSAMTGQEVHLHPLQGVRPWARSRAPDVGTKKGQVELQPHGAGVDDAAERWCVPAITEGRVGLRSQRLPRRSSVPHPAGGSFAFSRDRVLSSGRQSVLHPRSAATTG